MLGLLLNVYTSLQSGEKPPEIDETALAAFEHLARDDNKKRPLINKDAMTNDDDDNDKYTQVASKKKQSTTRKN